MWNFILSWSWHVRSNISWNAVCRIEYSLVRSLFVTCAKQSAATLIFKRKLNSPNVGSPFMLIIDIFEFCHKRCLSDCELQVYHVQNSIMGMMATPVWYWMRTMYVIDMHHVLFQMHCIHSGHVHIQCALDVHAYVPASWLTTCGHDAHGPQFSVFCCRFIDPSTWSLSSESIESHRAKSFDIWRLFGVSLGSSWSVLEQVGVSFL